ncbi:MAG: RNA polymerase sigma factor RpoD/SigA [Verrucomicrobia bacterium]|nr:RNA polymerase sigma factor RpoD/SigA [Verrucomicrobiota bacterium]MDA1065170.1 RNA polymerase sigma factor RpoD/SigA [Verrucomicrobiota bacterium]
MTEPKHSSEESFKDSPSPDIRAVASIRDVPDVNTDKKEELSSSERSSIKLYLKEIGQIDLLKPEQEVQLARRIAKGDKQARDMMIRANLRLVVKIANDYSNYGLPLSDLVSEGNIGLIKAVERFDPDKGGKLSTYAAWWIKAAIKRALANQSKSIRLPVHLVDKISKIRRTVTQLTEELEREPTNEEVGIVLGVSASKIAHLKSVSVRPASLDAPIGDDDGTAFGDMIGDEKALTPFQNLSNKSVSNDISDMMNQLEEREAKIIRLRFGLDGDSPKTLEEVGSIFGITRERVRQLQNLSIRKMRSIMADRNAQRSVEDIKEENRQRRRMKILKDYFDQKKNEQAET